MSASLPQVARALQHVLTDVPDQLARRSGFTRRRSKVSAALFVQTVVLGWLAQPAASLHQLCQTAADRGLTLSPQGLAQRFTPAAADLVEGVLAAGVQTLVQGEPVAVAVLRRFPAVLVLDSTTIRLPDALAARWAGCGGRVATGTQAALKLTVRLDLRRGRVEGPLLSAGRAQDKTSPLQDAPLPRGALRLADLGFWSLATLRAIAAARAYFLSRLDLHTAVSVAGTRRDLPRWLAGQGDRVDQAVTLGVRAQLPARLLGARVPPAVAAARRRKLRAAAKREGRTPGKPQLALAGWTLLVTNAEPAQLNVAEALALARARWQIELLFKLWKDDGHLDEWRTQDPTRVRCELAAKLLALLCSHWVLLAGGWHWTVHSLTQAAQTVRAHAPGLALHLTRPARLRATLRAVARRLAAGCTIAKRRAKPSTHQLLTDPALGGLA